MEDKAVTEIWVTRWALTQGIFQETAKISADGKMAVYGKGYSRVILHGNDFRLTEEAAIQRAYIMRAKKLLSLQKQINKLQKLSFMKTE